MTAVIIVIIFVVLAWAFLAAPARRRQHSHRSMQDSVVVGDEIITAGGMHATVREAEPERLRIEIAPTVVVTLDRRAVAAVAVEEESESAVDDPAAPAGEGDGGGREPAAPRSPETTTR